MPREVALGESALIEGAAKGTSDLGTLPRLDVHTEKLSDAITEANVTRWIPPEAAKKRRARRRQRAGEGVCPERLLAPDA